MAGTKTAAQRQVGKPASKPAAPKAPVQSPVKAPVKAPASNGSRPPTPATRGAAKPATREQPAKVVAKAAKTVKSAKSAAPKSAARTTPAVADRAPATRATPKRASTNRSTATRTTATRTTAKRGAKKGARRVPPKPPLPVVRVVKVKQLDPLAKCGPGTSVEQLFRVDEDTNGHATVHLVFLDRHGWYCVHGPRCAAVADVHSHNRTVQRARAGGR